MSIVVPHDTVFSGIRSNCTVFLRVQCIPWRFYKWHFLRFTIPAFCGEGGVFFSWVTCSSGFMENTTIPIRNYNAFDQFEGAIIKFMDRRNLFAEFWVPKWHSSVSILAVVECEKSFFLYPLSILICEYYLLWTSAEEKTESCRSLRTHPYSILCRNLVGILIVVFNNQPRSVECCLSSERAKWLPPIGWLLIRKISDLEGLRFQLTFVDLGSAL